MSVLIFKKKKIFTNFLKSLSSSTLILSLTRSVVPAAMVPFSNL